MKVDALINEFEKTLDAFAPDLQTDEIGIVQKVGDGIATVSGLTNCQSSEMLDFGNNIMGIALNLERDEVGAVLLGDTTLVKQGGTVKRTGKILSVPVSNDMVGRVVNPLMQPVDGQGAIAAKQEYPIEKIAPGVMTREPVNQPLQTGIKVIDALVPIGRGQRELIIGDRQTGKTTLAIDTILNQHDQDVLCVYVAIGQKRSKVMRTVEILRERGAMKYTTVVLAGASESAALSYLSPYAGVALAEFFMDQGKDVLVVYDDLTKHASAYREISLLLRRPPGREAYPGDVFYLHSRLLERACRRNAAHGGGSITALPIIETQSGDVSGYIPTNVISITDGQIFLESSFFNKGIRPAINPGISVSRVGGAAQIKAMKKNAGTLKLDMAQFRELESFAQFDSDLDASTKKVLARGSRLVQLMTQDQYSPLAASLQIAGIYAVNNGYTDNVPVEEISAWESAFIDFMKASKSAVLDSLAAGWKDEQKDGLKEACKEFTAMYTSSKE